MNLKFKNLTKSIDKTLFGNFNHFIHNAEKKLHITGEIMPLLLCGGAVLAIFMFLRK